MTAARLAALERANEVRRANMAERKRVLEMGQKKMQEEENRRRRKELEEMVDSIFAEKYERKLLHGSPHGAVGSHSEQQRNIVAQRLHHSPPPQAQQPQQQQQRYIERPVQQVTQPTRAEMLRRQVLGY